MKIPSNRMLKYEGEEYEDKWYYPVILWLFMILFLFGVVYVAYCTLFIRYFLIALFIYIAVTSIIDSKKHKKLKASRKDWGIGCFAKEFDLKVIDTWVIRAVYEAIYDLVELPIKADDEIDKDLRIDMRELEFDEILINVSQRTGRILPEESTKYDNIKTVRDLVEFFNALSVVKN